MALIYLNNVRIVMNDFRKDGYEQFKATAQQSSYGWTAGQAQGTTQTQTQTPNAAPSPGKFAGGNVNPGDQRWEGSYTQKVCDELCKRFPNSCLSKDELRGDYYNAIRQAYKLLKDYHKTQHLVYEQRDTARAERDLARQQRLVVHDKLMTERAAISSLSDTLAKTREELTKARAEHVAECNKVKITTEYLRDEIISFVFNSKASLTREILQQALRTYGVWRISELTQNQFIPFLETVINYRERIEFSKQKEELEKRWRAAETRADETAKRYIAAAKSLEYFRKIIARIHGLTTESHYSGNHEQT